MTSTVVVNDSTVVGNKAPLLLPFSSLDTQWGTLGKVVVGVYVGFHVCDTDE